MSIQILANQRLTPSISLSLDRSGVILFCRGRRQQGGSLQQLAPRGERPGRACLERLQRGELRARHSRHQECHARLLAVAQEQRRREEDEGLHLDRQLRGGRGLGAGRGRGRSDLRQQLFIDPHQPTPIGVRPRPSGLQRGRHSHAHQVTKEAEGGRVRQARALDESVVSISCFVLIKLPYYSLRDDDARKPCGMCHRSLVAFTIPMDPLPSLKDGKEKEKSSFAFDAVSPSLAFPWPSTPSLPSLGGVMSINGER